MGRDTSKGFLPLNRLRKHFAELEQNHDQLQGKSDELEKTKEELRKQREMYLDMQRKSHEKLMESIGEQTRLIEKHSCDQKKSHERLMKSMDENSEMMDGKFRWALATIVAVTVGSVGWILWFNERQQGGTHTKAGKSVQHQLQK